MVTLKTLTVTTLEIGSRLGDMPKLKKYNVIVRVDYTWVNEYGDWDTVDESAYFNLLVKYDIDGYGKYKNDPDYLEQLNEEELAELNE